jgi:HD superfamily phosphohydrolase YqeK
MRTIVLLILCATAVFSQEYLGGDDHDILAHKVVELTKTLRQKSLGDLRNYCVKFQYYSRHKLGQDDFEGGIEDYVWRLDENECIKYILSKTLEHRELLNSELFEQVVNAPQSFLSNDLGITDWAFRLNRKTLEVFALTCESYDNDKSGKGFLIGGIHDELQEMTNQEIANFIINIVKKYKELDSYAKLDEVSRTLGFNTATSEVFLQNEGGLHDYIWRVPREILIKWALTAENHFRVKESKEFEGGLHDYIDQLPNQEIIEYIMKKAQEYPELDNAETLDRLSIEYGMKN